MSGPYVPAARYSPRAAQPLENYVHGAKDVIEGLFQQADKDLPPFAQALKEQAERVRGAAARLFDTPDGREVLEYLCDATLRRPTFIAHLGLDPMRAYAHGVLREGQNTAVYLLLSLIAEGRGEQPVTREGASQ
jgi:hypothetical protein